MAESTACCCATVMFDAGVEGDAAGGVEVDVGGVAGVDVAADGLFAAAPDDPELFFLEAAELMAPITINARMTVRIGCRRNQIFFLAAG